MQIEKDGLHTYEVYPHEENDYYFSMEYPIINHNHPRSLLPIEIREEDGERKLLFDITGKTKIEDYYRKRQIGYEECHDFIKSMIALFEDLEDYMLSEEQVSFQKDDIYMDGNDTILWKYTPKCSKEIGKEIETLFLWILGQLDYHDQEGINFMHRIFYGISRQEFSRDYLQRCLNEEIKEEVQSEPVPPVEETKIFQPGRKKESKVLDILSDIISILCGLLILYGIWLVTIKGINTTIIIFLAGNLILGLGMQARRLFRKTPENLQVPMKEKKKEDSPANVFEHLEEQWGKGNETVFLSDISNLNQPTLTREGSGRTVKICVFPFYIGSEEGLNQLPLNNRAVSRQHAVITRGEADDSYYIEDLESKNGTFVNDRKIEENQEVFLQDASRISFADEVWIFQLK